jgi:hypothetical protein
MRDLETIRRMNREAAQGIMPEPNKFIQYPSDRVKVDTNCDTGHVYVKSTNYHGGTENVECKRCSTFWQQGKH